MGTRELTEPSWLPTLYARALLASRRSGGELPDTELLRPRVTVDRDHLAAYSRVCGFDLSDRLPLTYPHVLGFDLQLELMTSGEFPYPLLGLVHIANTVTRRRAVDAGEELAVRVRATEPGEHPKGRTFVVVTEVSAGDEQVWTGRSTYLYRTDGSSSEQRRSPEEPAGAPSARWRLPEDTGRRYADVSGDRNPIHLHWLTSRPFGFRRPIAHGMYTAARCLAALGPRIPGAVTAEVEFGAPVPLPATVEFHSRPDGQFALHGKGGRRHLRGSLRR
jgi:acyl dehydratase